MKIAVLVAAALLAGLFIGGLRPAAELRALKEELAEARESAARARSSAALPFALGMGSLVAARDRAHSVPRFVVPLDAGAPAAAEPSTPRPDGGGRPRRTFLGDAGAEAFAAIKTAADVRAAQFRAAFVEEAGLSPEKEQSLGQTIDRMNREFAAAADEIADALQAKGQRVRPREMADIGAKLLDIYRRADDSFTATLDATGRAALDRTQFDVLTQVDFGSFRRLAETMESLGVAQPGRGGGR
jgi:hypothetical protein